MKRFKSGVCPVCSSKLNIGKLACPKCKAEYPMNEEMNPFAYLTEQQSDFLKLYLQSRGNLKAVGERLNSSYPTVKRKLEELLTALGYVDEKEEEECEDMLRSWDKVEEAKKPSEIIRNRIIEEGGKVTVYSYTNIPYEITMAANGKQITCPQLPNVPYDFKVFDDMVNVMKKNGGKAKKGSGHKRLGDPGCEENTIAGAIIKDYYGKKLGETGLDPSFVLISVLEWAGIAKNQRGYVELTAEYKAKYC